MFISCTLAPEIIILAVIQEEENDGAPVKTFATTRSKAQEARTMPEATHEASSIVHPSVPLPLPKKNPAYTYESKAILPEVLKVVKQRILEAVIPGIMIAELMSISPELQKETMEHCKTQRIPVTASPELLPSAPVSALMRPVHIEHVNPLRELKVVVNGIKEEFGLLDGGSEIVIMREDL